MGCKEIPILHEQLSLKKMEIMNKKGKKIGAKVHPSFLNRDPLKKLSFETLDERNRYVVLKRTEGYTLQAIADSLGLTREMIRLIVNAQNGPTAETVRGIRIDNRKQEVKSSADNMTNPNIDKLAEKFGQNPGQVKKLLGTKAKKFPQGRRNFENIYSDEELLENLRSTAKKIDGPMSAKKFRLSGGEPTIAIFISRFGSWIKACELAGVKSGDAVRVNYKRAHSEETMLAYIASYLADPRTNGSAIGYDVWQRSVVGAPSLALIRQRLGKWNEIKIRLLS